MKLVTRILFVALSLIISTACENGSINQKVETVTSRAGTYVGEAKVFNKKTVVSGTNREETILFDGTISDIFTIEEIDVEEKKYSISRTEYTSGFYDIGDPNFEYEFDDDFIWRSGYKYDVKWVSTLDLSDPDQLEGYMLVEDVFGQTEYDSVGNRSKSYYFYEYEITALKQK